MSANVAVEPSLIGGGAGVSALRAALAERFPESLPLVCRTSSAAGTGLGPLDGLLPNAGLPRGRLSLWRSGGGATAVLRSVCGAAVERGERAAWVDGAGVATAEHWRRGVLLLRPRSELESLACGEELARSGGFGVVVLAGVGREVEKQGVRLSRAARSGGCALVVVGETVPVAALRLRSRLVPASFEWRRDPFGSRSGVAAVVVEVRAESMGWSGQTRLRLPVLDHAGRLAVEAGLPDRRGVASGWGPESARVWWSERDPGVRVREREAERVAAEAAASKVAA